MGKGERRRMFGVGESEKIRCVENVDQRIRRRRRRKRERKQLKKEGQGKKNTHTQNTKVIKKEETQACITLVLRLAFLFGGAD